jgi:DNA-binding CsgD family transcriptional regulator
VQPATRPRSLFGRELELARIESFLDGDTGPASLGLEGEPGIGKTTLWRAGVDAARDRGLLVLSTRPAEAERELSFSALGDLLEPARGRFAELALPRRRALELALLLAPDDGGLPDQRAVGLATLDLLRLLADETRVAIAVDDAQWLDPPSRATLDYVLRRLDGEPVALLTASRPGAQPLALGEPDRIDVGPLSLGALHEVIRARAPVPGRPTLIRIHETSGGNPFFALELVRALDGRELLPGEPLPVPAALSELTLARFAPLGPEAREVMLLVAALGRPTVEVVTEATGGEAAAVLDAAAAAGLIEVDGTRLRFTHPLLASVLYGTASPEERARVHRRLGEVVTETEERGRHLGAAATEREAGVAAALDAAAAAARGRGAPAAAAELAELAVQFTPEADAGPRLRRLSAAADDHFAAGSTVRARALLELVLAEAPRGRERARVAFQLAALLETHDARGAEELLARALREAEGDPELRARVHRGLVLHRFDDARESRRQAHVALALAERVGDARLVAESISLVVERDFWAGAGIDDALIQRGIALEEDLPSLTLAERPTCLYAFSLKWAGEIERAAPLWERLRELGRSTGDLGLVGILFFSTYHELIAEQWERGRSFADEALALAVDAERDVEAAMCRWGRLTIDAYQGRADETRAAAAEAARLSELVDYPHLLVSGLAGGVLELSVGNPETALGWLRPATEEKRAGGVGEPGLLLGVPEHVEAAIACGELEEAAELLDFFEARALRLDRAWALGCAARGRALLANVGGDDAMAERAFARAYEQHARRPQQLPTYELARTLLLHGSILRRRQRKREARDALERAAAIFERLGAQAYAERARSELARIGGRTVAAGDELTETERLVAELVAQGLSNKEVAAALSLSPKTVEWNLSKVYAKLGVRSRTELASRTH